MSPEKRPLHNLDLSSRSERRMLGRAVRENWPVKDPIAAALVQDLMKEFPAHTETLADCRKVILIARTFVAMEGLNQAEEFFGPLPHYRRWRQGNERRMRAMMRR